MTDKSPPEAYRPKSGSRPPIPSGGIGGSAVGQLSPMFCRETEISVNLDTEAFERYIQDRIVVMTLLQKERQAAVSEFLTLYGDLDANIESVREHHRGNFLHKRQKLDQIMSNDLPSGITVCSETLQDIPRVVWDINAPCLWGLPVYIDDTLPYGAYEFRWEQKRKSS